MSTALVQVISAPAAVEHATMFSHVWNVWSISIVYKWTSLAITHPYINNTYRRGTASSRKCIAKNLYLLAYRIATHSSKTTGRELETADELVATIATSNGRLVRSLDSIYIAVANVAIGFKCGIDCQDTGKTLYIMRHNG